MSNENAFNKTRTSNKLILTIRIKIPLIRHTERIIHSQDILNETINTMFAIEHFYSYN